MFIRVRPNVTAIDKISYTLIISANVTYLGALRVTAVTTTLVWIK